ncbi:hypothetical protein NDU88_004583 [Pleurodeles waltl]|uniref:Uncharacterized protein n=1 Tax=Pleurodeles waltl TaxID=8319 RepID=A0AAV7KYU4_PLEWA|nr:hypothetical protein NDU88_004583 [Pleurodeles waltl]
MCRAQRLEKGGAWPDRRARWPSLREALPGPGPFIRIFSHLTVLAGASLVHPARRSPWTALGGSGAAVRPEQLRRDADGTAVGHARARKVQGGRADAEARDCSWRCVAGCGAAPGGYSVTRPSRGPVARSITVALPRRRTRGSTRLRTVKAVIAEGERAATIRLGNVGRAGSRELADALVPCYLMTSAVGAGPVVSSTLSEEAPGCWDWF